MPSEFELPPLPVSEPSVQPQQLALDDFFEIDEGVDKNGKKQVVYVLSSVLVAHAAVEYFQPVTYARVLYIYNRETGLYRADSGEVEEWCTRLLTRIYLEREKYGLKAGFRKSRFVDEVYKEVCRTHVLSVDQSPFDNYPGFPVNNCVIMIDVVTGTLTAKNYEPAMLFTRKSPVDYDPSVASGNTIEILPKWVSGVNFKGQELWRYLVQIPAQAVIQSLPRMEPFKQAYLLIGEHDSGKSTYNLAIQGLFGRNSVSTKPLQSFTGRFDLGDLVHILVNFGDDLTASEISDGNQFKTMIGIDDITVEQKFRQSYKARIYAVHVYSSNTPPNLVNSLYTDDAWWSRWQIIVFNGFFERDPSWISKNLTKEFYRGFLLLVLQEILRIVRNNMKLLLTQEIDEVKNFWLTDRSLFHQFFTETFHRSDKDVVRYQDVMDSLQIWADTYMPIPDWVSHDSESVQKYRNESKLMLPLKTMQSLSRALEKEGIGHRNTTRNGISARYYTGFRFKNVPWKP